MLLRSGLRRQLDARWKDSSVQSKRAHREDSGDRRYSPGSGHRIRDTLQQRPWYFSGRHAVSNQRQLAGGASLARLHRANWWRHAAADHAAVSFVLAWLVSRRKDAGVRRRTEW